MLMDHIREFANEEMGSKKCEKAKKKLKKMLSSDKMDIKKPTGCKGKEKIFGGS
jgi:hypothetical protein